jgi:hypothetical protein
MLPTLDAPGEDADGLPSGDDEAEEDLPEANSRSFVTASQIPAKKPTRAIKKLQALKDWTHINCSADDDTILDNVEDEVLRQAVTAGFERMRLAARADQLAELERAEDDEEALAERARGPQLSFQGGEISYVFHVSSPRAVGP